jgi:hypothetical protein
MKPTVLVTGAALVSISAALIFFRTLHNPVAPLTSNLGSGKWSIISERFDERVKQAFPIGSSEKQMTEERQRQGFSQIDRGKAMGQEREAVRREDSWYCNIAARDYWSADASGRLIAVRGHYGEEGCL